MSDPAKKPHPPTLLGQGLVCATAVGGTSYLLPLAQAGSGPAGFGALTTAGVALLAGIKTLNAWDQFRDRRARQRRLESFAKSHGPARHGTVEDARTAGLVEEEGLILGRLGEELIRYPGEAGVIVAGRPGSWKGVGFVIPNLLLAPRPTKKKFQSYIVTDFSGELYACCHRRLRELGYRIVVLASEAERLSADLGVEIISTRHNSAAYLVATSPELLEEVATFVHLLHPGVEPAKQNGSSQHFDELARQVLTTFILWQLDRYGTVLLPGLRRCVMSTSAELHAVLEEAIQSDAFGGALAESGASLLSLMTSSPEEFSGAITTATRAVHLYAAESPLGKQVSEHQFDWLELKRMPTVVFVIVPPERLKSQAQFVNLTISASAEALVRDRSRQRVIYLLDEVGHLFIPNLLTIVSLYRKYGLQVVFILQQLEAQLARIYGKEAARELQGNCEVIMALSTTELEDLKRLSELAGQETVADGSHTLREQPDGPPEVVYNGSYHGRPLLSVDEIRLLEKNQGVVLCGNVRPLIVDLVNYLQEPKLQRLADDNPYYQPRPEQETP